MVYLQTKNTYKVVQRKKLIIKLTSIFVLMFFNQSLFSQDVSSKALEKIYKDGKAFTTPLKNGQIESLKKANPSKDSWTYSKLEEYKRNLNSEDIIYGQIIIPSADEAVYSYNLFAYDLKEMKYYFVAIASYKIIGDDIKKNGTYLFTEKKGLNFWWSRTFRFYESDLIKKIPEKYVFKVCPPPPKN